MGKDNSVHPVGLVLDTSLAFLLKASSFQLSTSSLAIKEHLEKGTLVPSCSVQECIPSIKSAKVSNLIFVCVWFFFKNHL